eukprot:NODE_486_length_7793_cov_0.204315.p1 type:complete len:501 gc:universal NODE_486_length_7793_cov_0.204315:1870-3372(+)
MGLVSLLNASLSSFPFDFKSSNDYFKYLTLHADEINPLDILKSFNRKTQLNKVKNTPLYDIVIIGGGATGAGCLYQATLRGYSACLVDSNDFASQTSSKSTKLLHGGIRYLEKAFWNLDKRQYDLVTEALHERKHFFQLAPYLCYNVPILIPADSYLRLPYFYAGAKVYDWLSGKESLNPSFFLSKQLMLSFFPQLNPSRFIGGVIYYDGMQNDARMNMMLCLTSCYYGANLLNYVEVTKLTRDSSNAVNGVVVVDKITNESFEIHAKAVINATGPFTDTIMKLDNPNHENLVVPSRGTHLTLPSYICPSDMGIVDPSSDGRVTYLLPWQNEAIAGTTDVKCDTKPDSTPSQSEIDWILKELKTYLHPDLPLDSGDIKSSWSGIRPLIRDPDAKDTKELVRSHKVITSPSGLISIVGGKWTTYRQMAKDTLESIQIQPSNKSIHNKTILGGAGWNSFYFIELMKEFKINEDVITTNIDCETYIAELWHIWIPLVKNGNRK